MCLCTDLFVCVCTDYTAGRRDAGDWGQAPGVWVDHWGGVPVSGPQHAAGGQPGKKQTNVQNVVHTWYFLVKIVRIHSQISTPRFKIKTKKLPGSLVI